MRAHVRLALACSLAGLVACSFLTATDELSGGSGGVDGGGASGGDATGKADGTATNIGDAAGNLDAPIATDGPLSGCDDAGCPGGCIDGYCLAKPTRVLSAPSGIASVAVSGLDLYYSRVGDVFHQPLDGGIVERIVSAGTARYMAIDNGHLYFPDNGDIFRAPLDGGAAEPIYQQYDSPINSVTLSGANLYYVGPDPGSFGVTSLFSIPKGGGVDAGTKYLTKFSEARCLHAAGSTIYIGDRGANVVWTVPVGGTTATQLLAVPDVWGIFVDPPWMWLTSDSLHTVYRTLADGTGPLIPIAVGQQQRLSQVFVTSTTVYWAAGVEIWSLPR